ncbi:hypothetical protein [Sinomonas humi]|uniref:hypothetical protein n=1 Tax=Sinomonas humi TaxID=1338436 RepID=UPI0018CDE881|nr:hypothetical protein [Sinomonas humi]
MGKGSAEGFDPRCKWPGPDAPATSAERKSREGDGDGVGGTDVGAAARELALVVVRSSLGDPLHAAIAKTATAAATALAAENPALFLPANLVPLRSER